MKRILAVLAVAMGLAVPATAQGAIGASVTGDTGAPVGLTPGAPVAIRNMDVKAVVHVEAVDAKSFKAVVIGPDNLAATTETTCADTRYTIERDRYVDYKGNGLYTLALTLFSDANCTTQQSAIAFQWTVNASVQIGAPTGALLTRPANSFTSNTHLFAFAGNPGASSYEVKYAKGGVLLGDGSISSPVLKDAYVDAATGGIPLRLSEPGDYVMVARARYLGVYSPWSAPVYFKLIAPFDISTRSFPDARGPSYQLRGVLRETSAAGSRVTVAVAKGKKGKRFRTLGKARVTSKGVFKLRFTIRQLGYYRLRYSFSGNSSVARGTVYETIRIRRVLAS